MTARVVALVAHGTADPAGQEVLAEIRDAVAQRLPDADVRLAYVDVIEPTPASVLQGTRGAVLVPLFLASGFHVAVDIAAAVTGADAAYATAALGPDPLVADALADRVRSVDPRPGAVVLAAAGSSRASARAEVEVDAQRLAVLLGCPVTAAFLGGPGTSLAEALEGLARDEGGSARAEGLPGVVVASHLLAPGQFHTRAARLAAEHGVRCTDPIGAHPRIVDLVERLATSAPTHSPPTVEEAHP